MQNHDSNPAGHWYDRAQVYMEQVDALRTDLEQTTDERNALLHARTALRAELAEVKHQRDVLAREMPSIERAVDVEMVRADNAEAELERVTTERDDAYALIRHYADTDPEVALAELMRPVVEAAAEMRDDPKWGQMNGDEVDAHAWAIARALDAFRVATSEYVCDYGTACIGPDCEMEHTHRVATSEQHPYPCHAKYGGDCTCTCPKASEQEMPCVHCGKVPHLPNCKDVCRNANIKASEREASDA